VIEKKRNLAQSPRKYAIFTLRSNKFFLGRGHCPWRLRRLDSARAPQLQLLHPYMIRVRNRTLSSSVMYVTIASTNREGMVRPSWLELLG